MKRRFWLPCLVTGYVAIFGFCTMSVAGVYDVNTVAVSKGDAGSHGRSADAAQAAAPARDGNIAILEEYDMAVRLNTVAAYQLFIMRHPSHPNAELARQHIRSLQSATKED